ncbi:hypothetical protein C8R47DRAFT_1268748 [Mycena vitilis]|nr:hypothetical protein C8R47DRAFT_1268748 [Mycena vitilis]
MPLRAAILRLSHKYKPFTALAGYIPSTVWAKNLDFPGSLSNRRFVRLRLCWQSHPITKETPSGKMLSYAKAQPWPARGRRGDLGQTDVQLLNAVPAYDFTDATKNPTAPAGGTVGTFFLVVIGLAMIDVDDLPAEPGPQGLKAVVGYGSPLSREQQLAWKVDRWNDALQSVVGAIPLKVATAFEAASHRVGVFILDPQRHAVEIKGIAPFLSSSPMDRLRLRVPTLNVSAVQPDKTPLNESDEYKKTPVDSASTSQEALRQTSQSQSSYRLRSLSVAMHSGVVAIHLALLAIASKGIEHGVVFSLDRQKIVSFTITGLARPGSHLRQQR